MDTLRLGFASFGSLVSFVFALVAMDSSSIGLCSMMTARVGCVAELMALIVAAVAAAELEVVTLTVAAVAAAELRVVALTVAAVAAAAAVAVQEVVSLVGEVMAAVVATAVTAALAAVVSAVVAASSITIIGGKATGSLIDGADVDDDGGDVVVDKCW